MTDPITPSAGFGRAEDGVAIYDFFQLL